MQPKQCDDAFNAIYDNFNDQQKTQSGQQTGGHVNVLQKKYKL